MAFLGKIRPHRIGRGHKRATSPSPASKEKALRQLTSRVGSSPRPGPYRGRDPQQRAPGRAVQGSEVQGDPHQKRMAEDKD